MLVVMAKTQRKGLGTVIATVIFIFIMLFTVSNLYMWYFNRLDEYNQALEQMLQFEEERANERVRIVSAYPDTDGTLILNLANYGSTTAHLVHLWVNNEKYPMDIYLEPGSSLEYDTGVGLEIGEEYEIKVVSERGSIDSFHLALTIDARLNLIAPGAVYFGQEFTVLLLVTNVEDYSYPYNVEPTLTWTGVSPTLVEGPIPPSVSLLPPQSTAAFRWKLEAPSTTGTINFTGSFKVAGQESDITDPAST
ncbi:TPA: hypothetical protein EYP27_00525, partial [Candidatus Bathyarchaeota archaeon]|nr:hypothetical protein [Candidatus Bathyarchaeota archaeon]